MHDVTTQMPVPLILYPNLLKYCINIFCGVTADYSNCHFKSKLVCLFVFANVIRFNLSVCFQKLEGQMRNLEINFKSRIFWFR